MMTTTDNEGRRVVVLVDENETIDHLYNRMVDLKVASTLSKIEDVDSSFDQCCSLGQTNRVS